MSRSTGRSAPCNPDSVDQTSQHEALGTDFWITSKVGPQVFCCLDACLAGSARAPVLSLHFRKHKRAEDRVCDYHASLYNELAARRCRLRPEAASQKHSKVHLGTSLPHHCLPSGVELDHCRIPQEFCHRRPCATTTSVPIGLIERSPRHLRMRQPHHSSSVAAAPNLKQHPSSLDTQPRSLHCVFIRFCFDCGAWGSARAGGPKLRKWYGQGERPTDGGGGVPGQDPDPEPEAADAPRKCVLVTDAESPTGQAVVLQLILARRGRSPSAPLPGPLMSPAGLSLAGRWRFYCCSTRERRLEAYVEGFCPASSSTY